MPCNPQAATPDSEKRETFDFGHLGCSQGVIDCGIDTSCVDGTFAPCSDTGCSSKYKRSSGAAVDSQHTLTRGFGTVGAIHHGFDSSRRNDEAGL